MFEAASGPHSKFASSNTYWGLVAAFSLALLHVLWEYVAIVVCIATLENILAELITGAQLARKWGCSREWVAKLARDGRIVPEHTFGVVRLFAVGTVRPEKRLPGRKPAAAGAVIKP